MAEGSEGKPLQRPRLWRDDEEPIPEPHEVSPAGIWDREDRDAKVGSRPDGPARFVEWDGNDKEPTGQAPSTNGKVGDKRSAPEALPRKKPKRVRRLVGLFVALLILAVAAESAYVLLALRSSLLDTRSSLQQAREALASGEVDRAAELFQGAERSADEADRLSSRPSVEAVSSAPLLGMDAEALQRMTRAARLASEAGGLLARSTHELGVSDEGLAAQVYRNGEVQFESIRRAMPFLEEAEVLLNRADAVVANSPDPLIPLVRTSLERARTETADAARTATNARSLFSVLPDLFGENEQKKYLLAFQASGEARATGGVIGLYGTLIARDGRVQLGSIGSYKDIVPGKSFPDAVAAPTWFTDNYGSQFATRQWQQANLSPNFPAVAEVLLNMYFAGTGERLDGVVAMDPLALEKMMEGTGPLSVGGEEIGAEEVAELILEDSYTRFERPAEQDAFLGSVIDAFWSKIKTGDFDAAALARGAGEAIRTRHLMVHAESASSRDALSDFGAGGEYATTGGNTQLVFHNNYAVNKIDYYLRRSISTDIALNRDGTADIKTVIDLRNEAPSGPKSLLLGPGVSGDEPGLNRMILHVLAPTTAEIERVAVDGDEVPAKILYDDEFPVAWHVLELPSGNETRVVLRYTLMHAIDVEEGIPRFRFAMVPQPLPTPDEVSLTVNPPPGFAFVDRLNGSHNEVYEHKGKLDSTLSIDLEVAEP